MGDVNDADALSDSNECTLEACQSGRPVTTNTARNLACNFAGGAICNGSGLCIDPDWANWPMPNGAADVTAGAPNPMGYTDHGDGTVTDTVTGLMWQKAVAAGTYDWAGAMAYCDDLDLAAYSDWRLPSRTELISIVDYSVAEPGPAIRSDIFPATPTGFFWASTRSQADYVWVVLFYQGRAITIQDDDDCSARCVR